MSLKGASATPKMQKRQEGSNGGAASYNDGRGVGRSPASPFAAISLAGFSAYSEYILVVCRVDYLLETITMPKRTVCSSTL